MRTGITLELNQAAVINFALDVGIATERVEVVGDAALLESTTSDLGKVVDNRRILDLPLNTRNVFTLINLTPGALGSSSIPLRRPGVVGLRRAHQHERDRGGRRDAR